MGHNIVETLVGAFVLLMAGLFLFYGYSVSSFSAREGYHLTAEFDRVDGLVSGADVRLSGIKVGTVTAQELDPETYYARVQLSLYEGVRLPEDSSAKITAEGLLGGNYVALTPGGSPAMLGDGDEILYTQGSIDLISLVSQALFSTEADESQK